MPFSIPMPPTLWLSGAVRCRVFTSSAVISGPRQIPGGQPILERISRTIFAVETPSPERGFQMPILSGQATIPSLLPRVFHDDAINRRDHETLDWRDINVASTNWLAWKYRT